MNDIPVTCPMTREQVIDRYFLEHRQKVLDIAAFLDRIDRAKPADEPWDGDYRVRALIRAIDVLRDGKSDRARRVQEVFSDPTDEPVESAEALGPATGAHRLDTK